MVAQDSVSHLRKISIGGNLLHAFSARKNEERFHGGTRGLTEAAWALIASLLPTGHRRRRQWREPAGALWAVADVCGAALPLADTTGRGIGCSPTCRPTSDAVGERLS